MALYLSNYSTLLTFLAVVWIARFIATQAWPVDRSKRCARFRSAVQCLNRDSHGPSVIRSSAESLAVSEFLSALISSLDMPMASSAASCRSRSCLVVELHA